MLRKRLVVRWAVVVFALLCVAAICVVCNWRAIYLGVERYRLEAYVMDHRGEIEAGLREVYNEWEGHYNTWEMYKDSADEEEFEKAADAWDKMRDVGYAASLASGGHYERVKLEGIEAIVYGQGDEIWDWGAYYSPNEALAQFEEIFWGGDTPLTDLPRDIPELEMSRDFPRYEASGHGIEYEAMGLHDYAFCKDYRWKYENVERYDEFVTKNREVLQQRGFFEEHLTGLEMRRRVVLLQAREYVYDLDKADSLGDVVKCVAVYNDYVSREENKVILEEEGFFEEYPMEITLSGGSMNECPDASEA